MGLEKGLKRVLFSEEAIQRRIEELGAEITRDYRGIKEPLLVVGLLRGVVIFLADLVRAIDLPLEFDFITVSSYRDADSPGELRLLKDLEEPVSGRDLLLVEDIIDTGKTLKFIQESLLSRSPRSLKTCCLIDKTPRREVDVRPDYIGFRLEEDKFLVGYGLDYAGLYRNLPYITALET
ncbi:TPA: hypoxanthine phosphoribosyltransferase [Candidatus Bipolaricaulota bacterium]|nr:hypoxanthine phosphoribosyltransferase [Candidatus Bipolaricaulota bacterium]